VQAEETCADCSKTPTRQSMADTDPWPSRGGILVAAGMSASSSSDLDFGLSPTRDNYNGSHFIPHPKDNFLHSGATVSVSYSNSINLMIRLAGFVVALSDPVSFAREQVPATTVLEKLTTVPMGTQAMAMHLGNLYLLCGLIGLSVLWTTTDPKLVKYYIISLWICDINHMAISGWALGQKAVLDIQNWNSMAWGNIGITVSAT
jgi:hypothetical protein